MGAKRALIVDDSKSARLFLSRILVQHAIEVETAESAEEAIEYLGDHRPDVIFMDHQMGGMDGLSAVKLIKNNPITATIPIMMYTSQEGELYVGQARALGAVGVMPKQIKQADVSKVLYDLHLLPDRRARDSTDIRPVTLDALAEAAVVAERAAPAIQSITETALREQFDELRRALITSIETQSDRITADFHAALRETPLFATTAATETPPPVQTPWAWVVATVALVVAVASTSLWWHAARLQQITEAQLSVLQAYRNFMPPAAQPAREEAQTLEASAVTVAHDKPQSGPKLIVMQVPYGESPLEGARLDGVRQLFHRLIAQRFHGNVDIRTFVGRFCLVGNASDGYSLAPDELPYARCDSVSNPDAEAAQREPLAFANLRGELRGGTKGTASAGVAAGDPGVTATPYPEVSAGLTAGEWNHAAAINNRVEIRLR